jgi:hypothetical protein
MKTDLSPSIYRKLACSGRFYNTGKVLIGVRYVVPSNRRMSRDEERMQAALLGLREKSLRRVVIPCLAYAGAVAMLIGIVAAVAG